VGWGLGLQLLFAFLVIKWTVGQQILAKCSYFITSFLGHSVDGSSMVFGPLGDPKSPLNIFAFAVLPTIIFVSAFFAVLYHLGIMQWVIRGMAWVMQRTMGTSGAESTNVAASIFMGQTEAPLTIRPFLNGATRSELMTIMTSGMAHVSGGIMAAYISFGIHAKDLLSAVIMTAPGTILLSKMLVPETEVPATAGTVHMPPQEGEHSKENLIGAIARGTIDGGQLAFNVAIMLISFLALVGLANAHGISARSLSIATFALCGFANLGSIGMQIGGIGALAPSRRNDLARLGLRAMLAGTMANLVSASIVSMLIS
jgi:CNT family concentrative nucleoside transporter